MAGLKKLREGARRFQQEVFHQYRELFETLAKGQRPTTLVITCADSRVDPALISGAKPGEIFVERNPGALVPIYSNHAVGVSASIEYAVLVLGVRHVVICAHSDCGAMSATLHPEKTKGVPAVARWLSYARPALDRLSDRERAADPHHLQQAFTKHCVRVQMEHLLSHPSVQAAVAGRKLTVSGAYYDIPTGRISRVSRPARPPLRP
jgi:carbonic anhydrase